MNISDFFSLLLTSLINNVQFALSATSVRFSFSNTTNHFHSCDTRFYSQYWFLSAEKESAQIQRSESGLPAGFSACFYCSLFWLHHRMLNPENTMCFSSVLSVLMSNLSQNESNIPRNNKLQLFLQQMTHFTFDSELKLFVHLIFV